MHLPLPTKRRQSYIIYMPLKHIEQNTTVYHNYQNPSKKLHKIWVSCYNVCLELVGGIEYEVIMVLLVEKITRFIHKKVPTGSGHSEWCVDSRCIGRYGLYVSVLFSIITQ
jgi:hypothetical protein